MSAKRFILGLVILLVVSVSAPSQTFTVNKTPFERIDLEIDFSKRLCPDGTTTCAPNGITFNSVQVMDGTADVTSQIVVLSPDTPVPAVVPSTDKVIVRVKGGTTGHQYIVAMRIQKVDSGEYMEGSILMRVVATQ